MRRILLTLAILAFPLTAFAQASDFGIFVNTTNFKSTTQSDPDFPSEQLKIDFDQKMGYGVAYNRYFSPSLSTEFGYSQIRGDGNVTVTGLPKFGLGEFKSNVFTGILQWHFAPRAFIDPYIGGGASYFQGGKIEIPDDIAVDGDTVKFDNKAGYVANAGINLAITKGMMLAVDARYMPYKAQEKGAPSSEAVSLDPLVISAGIRLRR
jgi:outer membrane protein W